MIGYVFDNMLLSLDSQASSGLAGTAGRGEQCEICFRRRAANGNKCAPPRRRVRRKVLFFWGNSTILCVWAV